MSENNLFVSEDEEMPPVSDHEQEPAQPQPTGPEPEDDDDPIIRSIPLVHGSLPNRQLQSLHVLQFAGRPKAQNFAAGGLKALVKPGSKVVQLQTPMNTEKFYNLGRALELGGHVENLALQGVLTETNGGLYAGRIIDQDGEQKFVLIPLDSTAQLRPLFKYIDDLDSARYQQVRQENSAADPQKLSAVQVLQTASKPGSNPSAEGQLNGGVGSCLRHVKRFNEEEWLSLSWFGGQDSSTEHITRAISNPQADKLEASTVLDEFL
ncbi:hypothetical protein METBIDRAFT_37203 [Metschnikowia bicuspidata var. bicuspidata NRRL YB-4993]|uniref:Uncharacterized protein n=1 Tax=Metschnikowia bicuspidata var. bicuspidata NRRL YB-4993 TaxID=869754 RepID=A0A1A0HHT3_9ASCO|nr:hypothetical protein METBIDRAFT_37203 [Metschnikowia bicuspidata var. bicuspidata NRRL YB-4993]OBA23719.1 hypothetical protein METBIDRAFT_37203 [Metschnikowia bicuspidata var. bicuspidata NRRL YB-4993]